MCAAITTMIDLTPRWLRERPIGTRGRQLIFANTGGIRGQNGPRGPLTNLRSFDIKMEPSQNSLECQMKQPERPFSRVRST